VPCSATACGPDGHGHLNVTRVSDGAVLWFAGPGCAATNGTISPLLAAGDYVLKVIPQPPRVGGYSLRLALI
jgi:hypothetical protein